jgi:co-chaperonin GroES (HSP10)
MKNKELNFKPLNGNLLIIIPEVSKTTASGLIKSDSMVQEEEKQLDKYVTVAAVSDEVKPIVVGDKILLGVSNINTIIIDEIRYGIVHISGVVGIKY